MNIVKIWASELSSLPIVDGQIIYLTDAKDIYKDKNGARTQIGSEESIEVIDNLLSSSTEAALSANQGKVLKDELNSLDLVEESDLTNGSAPSTGKRIVNVTEDGTASMGSIMKLYNGSNVATFTVTDSNTVDFAWGNLYTEGIYPIQRLSTGSGTIGSTTNPFNSLAVCHANVNTAIVPFNSGSGQVGTSAKTFNEAYIDYIRCNGNVRPTSDGVGTIGNSACRFSSIHTKDIYLGRQGEINRIFMGLPSGNTGSILSGGITNGNWMYLGPSSDETVSDLDHCTILRGRNIRMYTHSGSSIELTSRADFGSSMRMIGSSSQYFYKLLSNGSYGNLIGENGSGTVYVGPASSQLTSMTQTTAVRGGSVRLYAHDGGVYLGASGSTAVTSDERLKDMVELDDRYLAFARDIIPEGYIYKDHSRIHVGFSAQKVEQSLLKNGLTTEEFAGLVIEYDVKEYDDEGNLILEMDTRYSLRYEEFISLVMLVQKADAERITKLEEQYETEISSLTERLNKLEQLIGE